MENVNQSLEQPGGGLGVREKRNWLVQILCIDRLVGANLSLFKCLFNWQQSTKVVLWSQAYWLYSNTVILVIVAKWSCMWIWKWNHKQSHSSWMSGYKHLVRLWKVKGLCNAQWKMGLFQAKAIMKDTHNFDLTDWRKKKIDFGGVSGLILSLCFLVPLTDWSVMKTLKVNATLLINLPLCMRDLSYSVYPYTQRLLTPWLCRNSP